MHPNPPFNQRHQQWKEGDPTLRFTRPHTPVSNHCLAVHWENGEEMIFYYAFLMSVKLYLPTDENLLVLGFTSEKLVLKGYRLKHLCKLFTYEKPSMIQVKNSRYTLLESGSLPVVILAYVECL